MPHPGTPPQGCCGEPEVCHVGLGFNTSSFAMRAGLADTTILHPFRLLRFHTKLLSPLGFPIRLGGVLKVLFSTFPAYGRYLTDAETAHTAPPRTVLAAFTAHGSPVPNSLSSSLVIKHSRSRAVS